MSAPDDRQVKVPRDSRKECRGGNNFLKCTSGWCPGFTQVNLVLLPSVFANDFEGFCQANSGPMPLLFKSTPGQFTAPQLGKDIDVRSDFGAYEVLENGKTSEIVGDLFKFNDRIQNHVSFYFGCSFSFEREYTGAGLPLRASQQKRSTPLYITNVKCMSYGVFNNCNQYASMRPIPKTQLQLATQITIPMSKYHGAPMHIGDPDMIGVDLNKPDLGEALDFEEDDVAVFWSCGATGISAVKGCVDNKITKPDVLLKSALSLSHSSCVAIAIDDKMDINTTNNQTGFLTLIRVMKVLKMEVSVLVSTNTSSENYIKDIKTVFEKVDLQDVYVDLIPSDVYDNKYQTIDYVLLMSKTKGNSFVSHLQKTTKRLNVTDLTENVLSQNMGTADFNIDMGYENVSQTLSKILVMLRSCPLHERYQRRNVGYPQSTEIMESLKRMVAL